MPEINLEKLAIIGPVVLLLLACGGLLIKAGVSRTMSIWLSRRRRNTQVRPGARNLHLRGRPSTDKPLLTLKGEPCLSSKLVLTYASSSTERGQGPMCYVLSEERWVESLYIEDAQGDRLPIALKLKDLFGHQAAGSFSTNTDSFPLDDPRVTALFPDVTALLPELDPLTNEAWDPEQRARLMRVEERSTPMDQGEMLFIGDCTGYEPLAHTPQLAGETLSSESAAASDASAPALAELSTSIVPTTPAMLNATRHRGADVVLINRIQHVDNLAGAMASWIFEIGFGLIIILIAFGLLDDFVLNTGILAQLFAPP